MHDAKHLFDLVTKYSLNSSKLPTLVKDFVLLEHENQIVFE